MILEDTWEMLSIRCANCDVQVIARGGRIKGNNGLAEDPEEESEAGLICACCIDVELKQLREELRAQAEKLKAKDAEIADLRKALRQWMWAMDAGINTNSSIPGGWPLVDALTQTNALKVFEGRDDAERAEIAEKKLREGLKLVSPEDVNLRSQLAAYQERVEALRIALTIARDFMANVKGCPGCDSCSKTACDLLEHVDAALLAAPASTGGEVSVALEPHCSDCPHIGHPDTTRCIECPRAEWNREPAAQPVTPEGSKPVLADCRTCNHPWHTPAACPGCPCTFYLAAPPQPEGKTS